MTTNGRREFVFYAADADPPRRTLEELAGSVSSHELRFGVEEDRDWRGYSGLSP